MSIVVIHHERSLRKYENDSLLAFIAQRWRGRGIKVTNVYGSSEFVLADMAIVHVDLSVVPERYCDFAQRYPVSVNTLVTDIRKRTFSSLRITQPNTYDGGVIVKTNLNSGGLPERRIMRNGWPAPIRALHRGLEKALRGCGLSSCASTISNEYRTFDSAADVPSEMFDSPDLIVEQLVNERLEDRYCHRRYYFLGDAEVSQLWLGTRSICAEDTDDVEVHEVPTPEALREFRRRISIDYGKIDYVLDKDGQVIVLDVNKTPGGLCRNPEHLPWLNDLCDRLEAGILNLPPTRLCQVHASDSRPNC